MNPDQTLADLRDLVTRVHNSLYTPNDLHGMGAAEDFAELFEALDNWISRGGFLPECWRLNHDKTRLDTQP